MDFSGKDIREILKYSLPKRFQDMPPSDFEDFIKQLFEDLGYCVEQTPYSGDYGADLIIYKHRERIAVQIKRYAESNKVGVKDVNQVIGAKDYYKCDGAMIITTSEFTNPALKLVNTTNIKKWDWNDLQRVICDTYLDGKDFYSYYPDLSNGSKSGLFSFELTKIEYRQPMKRIGDCTLIYATLKNNGANTNVALELPIFISQSNKQVQAIYWYEGYFTSGTIYSGASVEIAFMFRSNQVSKINVGDRIIFRLHHENGKVETFDTKIKIRSYNGCYITIFCYGRNSKEYLELIYFRDNCLLRYKIGRKIIKFYYKNSGILISLLKDLWIARIASKALIKIITIPISALNNYLRNYT